MTSSSSRPPERPNFLDRRVTVGELDRASSDDANTAASAGSRWLEDYRNAPAYVLLGEPGSGKTTAFEMECAANPEGSERISARDFTELDIASHPEWSGKTLFIDGLDEVRAASSNWRGPLDSIRRGLEGLGHPRFRLSCRAGEWLGEDDADALRRLGSYHELVVLRLDPLDEDEVRTLLEDRVGSARAGELMRSAREYGLHGFLQHPLHIELLLEAGMGGGRISGRRALFESACQSMSREQNPAHRAARRGTSRPSEAALLNASGRLCALNLLTDSLGWAVDPAEPTNGYPSIREIENADSGAAPEELDGALRTRLFTMTSEGRFEVMHRQVAEFLAGRFLADQVERRDVSPARLRALMAGGDGAPAPSLRGLAAWIAVHSSKARPSLIRDDPVGVASYGDPSDFSPEDQKNLLSILLGAVRDPRRLPGNRAAALEAWLASSSGGGRDTDEALKILEEIREGRTHDPRGSLTGVGTSRATSSGLDPDEVRHRIAGHSPLERCLESLLAPTPQPDPEHPLVVKRAREREKWIGWVRQRADALGRGEAPPSLYHDIAKAYLGVNPSVRGNTPEERVRSLFLDDEALTRVSLDGLRRVARRTDLPTLNELLRYEEQREFSYFILPLLAALEEEEWKVNANGAHLEGQALQRALGAFFLARDYDGPDPAWYRRALVRDAAGVAAAFVKVYRSRIRRSSGVDWHMRALTHDESHKDVARAALPRLLRSFPAKATVKQLFYLDYLIPAALKHVDRDNLARIARRKLESDSLRIGHRMRWLATGMFLGDTGLGEQLDRFLAEGSDARVREFAAFLGVRTVSGRVPSLPPRWLAMIVKRLGGYFAPHSGGAPGFAPHHVADAIQTGGVIRNALDALSRLPSPEATEQIQALVDNEDLAAWREPVSKAFDAQRVVRLDAEFEPPTIPDVLHALEDGRPASSADLAALLQDRISVIGEKVRDGDANLWRHFWNEGPHGRAGAPKVESSCRDALLNALRPELPEGVEIEPEAAHAGGTSADMRITASRPNFAVPVEMKMTSSRDLWTAVTDQLIPRYTRDPRSDGYGVYVVFWHGAEHARRPTPEGKPPNTPDELQDRLTQQLAPDVQRKVSVIVLNVSPP